jgi:hypothetical protein
MLRNRVEDKATKAPAAAGKAPKAKAVNKLTVEDVPEGKR